MACDKAFGQPDPFRLRRRVGGRFMGLIDKEPDEPPYGVVKMRWCPRCQKGWSVPRRPTKLDDTCPECGATNRDDMTGYVCKHCGLTHLSLVAVTYCDHVGGMA